MNLSQKVAVNTTLLVLSRLVVAASGLTGVAISTRYLGPAHFGQLTVAIVFVSVFGFLTDVGLSTVVTREVARHPEQEQRLLSNAFSLGLALSAGALVLVLAVTLVAYGGPDSELIRLGVLILGVQMLFSAFGGFAAAHLAARQRAAPAAFAIALSGGLFVAGLIAVIELDLGFAGVAGCFAVTGVIALLLPLAAVQGVALRPARDPELWRLLLRRALPQGAVIAFAVIYFRIDTFLLSFLTSDAEVARYGVAYRVLEVLTVLPLFVMSTLFPEIAREQAHSTRLNDLVQGAFSSVMLAIVPMLIIFAGFAPDIVAVVGGPRYANAASVLQVLTLAIALLFVNTIFFHSLVALNRQRHLFVMLLAVLIANVALNLVLIPTSGAMGASIALVVSEGVALLLVLRIFAEVGTVPRLSRPVRVLGAAVATAAIVLGLQALLPVGIPAGSRDASFTAALGPLATLAGAAALTLGLWFGLLALLRAVPPELRAALAALRHRAPAETAVPPPVTG